MLGSLKYKNKRMLCDDVAGGGRTATGGPRSDQRRPRGTHGGGWTRRGPAATPPAGHLHRIMSPMHQLSGPNAQLQKGLPQQGLRIHPMT